MSTTAPEVTPAAPAQAEPTVGAPVEAAEAKVEAAVPEALKEPVAEVEKDFDEFAVETAKKGQEAAPAVEAAAEAEEPAIAEEAQDLKTGNLTGVVSNFGGVVKEVKAGWKTTEFWLVLAGVVLTQVGALRVPGKYGDTIQTSALIGSYAVSRGLAK